MSIDQCYRIWMWRKVFVSFTKKNKCLDIINVSLCTTYYSGRGSIYLTTNRQFIALLSIRTISLGNWN